MYEHTQAQFERHLDDNFVFLSEEIKRPTLLMIPKDNDFDP